MKLKPQLFHADKSLQAEGTITLTDAEITEDNSGIALRSIQGNIPWSWPQAAGKTKGEITVPDLRWRNVDLGSFRADITVKNMMYFLDGKYNSSLLEGVAARITGKAGMDASGFGGDLAVHTDLTQFPAINLGKIDPAFDQYNLSGKLGLDGSFKLASGQVNGSVEIKLQNTTLQNPGKNYEIRGIGLSMSLPALPGLHTAPAQTLNFTSASVGNLAFRNGKFVWQLESTGSFFLEQGVVQWAGGEVFTNAVRISSKMKEVVVPIFCDRLKLTELLHQFGISTAEGEGTVNGRIPLRIGRDTIRFEDGFLYSSPGQGGTVKVAALDLLSTGIPKNSPQFTQVDFAAEALKNFQYNWVKLYFNTEGEELIMQMQMDGKPVQSLPFTYDSETGKLQRTDNGAPGINQPIRLDVNFRLPFNRLLGYSGKIQEMMKKIK